MRHIILTLTILGLLFASCGSNNDKAHPTTVKTKKTEKPKIGEEPDITATWSYYTDINEMTDSTTENAVIGPLEMVRQRDYPFRPIALLLYVRYDEKYGNEVILAATSYATFDMANLESAEIEMRFDNEPVEYVTFVPPYPYSPHILFALEGQKLVDKLLTHKKLRIRAKLYDLESKVFHYNIEGFKWNYGRLL